MKRTILIVLAMAAGCDQSERTGSEVTDVKAAQPAAADNMEKSEQPAAADNTEKNERDRDGATLTPGDQAENEVDRTITQRVRRAIVGHDNLSMTAENVKIITINGVVTLRGPVKNSEERSTIETVAHGVEGVKRVDNQLEIASQ